MADLFVSYARADRPRVAPLVAALEAEGWSVWWDPEIAPGQEFDRLIGEELEKARAVIVVWTPTSVISRWVRGEAREAADRGVLAPVRFENAHLPIDLRAIHTTDLDAWADDARGPEFRELVRALRTLLREPGTQPTHGAESPSRLSICVLPFANLSGDPEQEYFSDGISEDIITDLSQISALHVVARNTAFTYKGKSVAIGQVARQLRVSHMLEGSVRKAGNRVRITAQLIDAASEGHLWAKRWDRDLDDIFALQDEISEAIVSALKLKLLPEERQAIEKRGTSNAEAYNLYLMARRYYVGSSTKRRELAVRLAERAVGLDPNYAQAWAQIAVSQAAIANAAKDDRDSATAAWDAAEHALALNPDLADAHAAKARLLQNEGRNDEAWDEAHVALKLDPTSHFANYVAATVAVGTRRFAEGVSYNEAAVTADELDVPSAAFLMQCHLALGDMPAAQAAARECVARVEKAIASEPDTGMPLAYGVLALNLLDEHERAKTWAEHALLLDPDDALLRYNLACGMSQSGQIDYALELLERSLAESGRSNLIWAKTDSDLDPLREDPRFKAIITKMDARYSKEAAAGSGVHQ
ncbi:MAG TPA: TIR domain-containing protein [Caulobacteraceae bacterium]|nr:TIR domain-containing protein [Caulobacteraceae bacterium]